MLKVMTVDDDNSFRGMFKRWLLTHCPSMEVVEAGSGEEALRMLNFNAFDLVFMDIHLPGENGLKITRKIKTEWQDLPVIILTSYDMPEYREAAIGYGANSFISKDSLKWEEISALFKCYQGATQNGRKPACFGFISKQQF